ncbi:hypothetical protein, partial [Xylella fastidiosa]|uniref:hypothetical protein n=1 Tax=Xylella fastidiosa TaxID=2371 RepID=UPI0019D47CEB
MFFVDVGVCLFGFISSCSANFWFSGLFFCILCLILCLHLLLHCVFTLLLFLSAIVFLEPVIFSVGDYGGVVILWPLIVLNFYVEV